MAKRGKKQPRSILKNATPEEDDYLEVVEAEEVNENRAPNHPHRKHHHPSRALSKQQQQQRRRPRQKNVRFGDIKIYEFPQILGDTICADGVPLTLSWIPVHKRLISVDNYEYARKPRRRRQALPISCHERELYLLSVGYSMDQLMEVAEAVNKIRKEREKSLRNQKYDSFHMVVESARKAMKCVSAKPTKPVVVPTSRPHQTPINSFGAKGKRRSNNKSTSGKKRIVAISSYLLN